MADHPLSGQQVTLETEMRTRGIERYRKAKTKKIESGRASETRAGLSLVEHLHASYAAAITGFQREVRHVRAKVNAEAARLLGELDDDDALALLACGPFSARSLYLPATPAPASPSRT